LGLDEATVRNELDPQPIILPLDKIKVFEVNGHKVDLSALPASSTAPEETTFPEEVRGQDLEKQISKYKHKILAALLPREVGLLKQLEARMAQNPNNDQLKEDFKECLLKACTTEYLQIRDFKADPKTQKKYLEVVRTCSSSSVEAEKGDGDGDAGRGQEE
jgi:hypothetical protein